LFIDAGIAAGSKVLDLGSGAGDVAMLVAEIVGPSGVVVGIERDPASVAQARSRVGDAGLTNVTFLEGDITELPEDEPPDAVVGRFILQFVPDPAVALKAAARLLRPGGIIAMQEPAWGLFLEAIHHLPLALSCASLIRQTFLAGGARTDMAQPLFQGFEEAGLSLTHARIELPVVPCEEASGWLYELLCAVQPQMELHGLRTSSLGDLATLSERLRMEATASSPFGVCVGLVGVLGRLP
jgi:SAM-dependent methyltransferase